LRISVRTVRVPSRLICQFVNRAPHDDGVDLLDYPLDDVGGGVRLELLEDLRERPDAVVRKQRLGCARLGLVCGPGGCAIATADGGCDPLPLGLHELTRSIKQRLQKLDRVLCGFNLRAPQLVEALSKRVIGRVARWS
jgi:hypothetical protein